MFSNSDYVTWKNVQLHIRNTIGFILKISFIDYKIEFLGKIDRFHLTFFGKSGQGGFFMDAICSLSSNINSLVRNKHFLFHGS